MKIRSKTLTGVGIVVLLLVLVSGVGIRGAATLSSKINALEHWNEIDAVLNKSVTQRIMRMEEATSNYQHGSSDELFQEYEDSYASAIKGLLKWQGMLSDEPALQEKADQISHDLEMHHQDMLNYQDLVHKRLAAKHAVTDKMDDLMFSLDEVMVEKIDPNKERAAESGNMRALFVWGEIDIVMNEAVIAKALRLETYLHDYFHEPTEKGFDLLCAQNEALRSGIEEWRDTFIAEGAMEKVYQEAKEHPKGFTQAFEQIHKFDLAARKLAAHMEEMNNQTHAHLDEAMESVIDPAKDTVRAEADNGKVQVLWISSIVSLAAIVLAACGGLLFSASLANPLRKAAEMLDQISKGRVSERLNMSDRKDEVGLMAKSMNAYADSLQTEIIPTLQALANGDLTASVKTTDDQDQLRVAIGKLGDDLNGLVGDIAAAGDQIAIGADQVYNASQTLSQGATEQASSLEEITSSMAEMNGQTNQNAQNAMHGNSLAQKVEKSAEAGNGELQNFVAAMQDINTAGENISKIIKTIDEIAFQTNLLALNAAVEAARAGQHGKGFAVVAEEVRNLAARSASAARETTELIEASITKGKQGSEIANATVKRIEGVTSGITQITKIVGEISEASSEQSGGISQINEGLNQIDQVTQANTASAEESAAAAEELASQAAQLQHLLQRFVLKGTAGQSHKPGNIVSPVTQPSPPVGNVGWVAMKQDETPKIHLDDTEFGRY